MKREPQPRKLHTVCGTVLQLVHVTTRTTEIRTYCEWVEKRGEYESKSMGYEVEDDDHEREQDEPEWWCEKCNRDVWQPEEVVDRIKTLDEIEAEAHPKLPLGTVTP